MSIQTQSLEEHSQGLWAYHKRKFYSLFFTSENKETDHVTWFREIGMPDFGPEFDTIIRGRMLWDINANHYVLSFYGMRQLPNHIYELAVNAFNEEDADVVERQAITDWG